MNEELIKRLETEAAALNGNLDALKDTLSGTNEEISETQRGYMMMQVNAMELYLDILHLRIDDLSAE